MVVALVTVLVGGIGALELVRPLSVLTVRVANTAGTAGGDDAAATIMLPLATDGRFEVRYRHSVNGFTVREQFVRNDDGHVVVVEHYVDGIGAGIDEVAGETTWQSVGGGWSRLAGLSRDLGPTLRLRVGGVADHRLLVDCHDVALLDRYPAGTPLEVGWGRTGPWGWIGAWRERRAAPKDAMMCALPGRAGG